MRLALCRIFWIIFIFLLIKTNRFCRAIGWIERNGFFIAIPILLEKLMDCAMWRFLSSGTYIWYVSIGKNRTSARRNFNAKFILCPTLATSSSQSCVVLSQYYYLYTPLVFLSYPICPLGISQVMARDWSCVLP